MFWHKLLLNLDITWIVPTEFGCSHFKGNITLWGWSICICNVACEKSFQIKYVSLMRNQELSWTFIWVDKAWTETKAWLERGLYAKHTRFPVWWVRQWVMVKHAGPPGCGFHVHYLLVEWPQAKEPSTPLTLAILPNASLASTCLL